MVSTDGKVFTTVVKDGYNTGALWSPDGKKFLFNRRDSGSQKMNLWMADIVSGEVKDLRVATTVAKAIWTKDSQYIYAGVPTTGNPAQGLTEDIIYKITVASVEQKEYAPGVATDLREPFLSIDEAVLFYRNAQDNALYYISLN